MPLVSKIEQAQSALTNGASVDGWLLYDFRHNNELACEFLDITPSQHLTRRFFYWIPASGEPVKICHAIEQHPWTHLPGKVLTYCRWQDLEAHVAAVLKGSKRVAMEYSPRNAMPSISKVDAGTVEMVRSYGVEVVSSADLLQASSSLWTEEQAESCRAAARVLQDAADSAWNWIGQKLSRGEAVTDYAVQAYLLKIFADNDCVTDGDPICAVNADSANPHFSPQKENPKPICAGDFILLDLWCKKNRPDAIYADITQVAVVAEKPTERQAQVFAIVRAARDAATDLIRERVARKQKVCGYEVDDMARAVITEAGFGDHFIHRTGHSLGTRVHANGANIDNLETQDRRELLAGTGFTIEPGIYLAGEFGVRLEYDVFLGRAGDVEVIGGIQTAIRLIKTG